MIVLKWLSVIVPAGIAIMEILRDKGKPRKYRRLLIAVTSISALIALGVIYVDDRDAGIVLLQQQFWQTNTTIQLTKIEGLGGDEAAQQRYFEIIRAANARFHAETKPVERFLETKSSRQTQIEQSRHVNREFANKHLFRIQSIHEFVISRFDTWMADLKKAGVKASVVTNEVSPLSIEGDGKVGGNARVATFEAGGKINMKLSSALVADGVLRNTFRLEINLEAPKFYAGDIWAVVASEKDYGVLNIRPERFGYPNYHGKLDNPLADAPFLNAVNRSFDEVMTYSVDQASAKH